MRILVVDDHEVVREGLLATLTRRYAVVTSAATGAQALAYARAHRPDVAIIDLRLPDMTGRELCSALRQAVPITKIVMLTTYISDETVRDALRAGASAYVTKSAGLGELIAVLSQLDEWRLGAGSTDSVPQIVTQLQNVLRHRTDEPLLTPQQESVLELAADGLTNQQIGIRLYISESTVRFHLQKLKSKLGARTKTELIAKAIRAGVISPAHEDATRSG
jgi:DNA-binding NarL/FixJ family response regulator